VLASNTSTKSGASTITRDDRTDPQQIITTIEALGYHASPATT
jgi:hypothetical protein